MYSIVFAIGFCVCRRPIFVSLSFEHILFLKTKMILNVKFVVHLSNSQQFSSFKTNIFFIFVSLQLFIERNVFVDIQCQKIQSNYQIPNAIINVLVIQSNYVAAILQSTFLKLGLNVSSFHSIK